MSKYSSELKLEIVNFYLKNNYSIKYVANHFGIPHDEMVRRWVKRFEKHGELGLSKNKKISYDGNFKNYVVKYMHDNHLSAIETAIYFNLGGTSVINKWERIYYEKGPQALYEERRGRAKEMNSKTKKKNLNKEEDLIAEIHNLRMENEYLKKLNALVQERIKRENKKK